MQLPPDYPSYVSQEPGPFAMTSAGSIEEKLNPPPSSVSSKAPHHHHQFIAACGHHHTRCQHYLLIAPPALVYSTFWLILSFPQVSSLLPWSSPPPHTAS